MENLQAPLGVTQNGTLALGQAVFLPSAAQVTALGQATTLGGPAQPGSAILSATSTTRVVTIDLDACPAERGGGRRPGDHHPAQQPDHAGHGVLGRHRRHDVVVERHLDHHRARHPDRSRGHRKLGPGPGRRDDHHRLP